MIVPIASPYARGPCIPNEIGLRVESCTDLPVSVSKLLPPDDNPAARGGGLSSTTSESPDLLSVEIKIPVVLLLRLTQVQRTLVGKSTSNMVNTVQNSCKISALHLLAE